MALLSLLVGVLCLLDSAVASGGHGRRNLLPPETSREYSDAAYFPEYNSKRVMIKYGAVSVPPMTKDDGMAPYFHPSTTLPCKDCYITWMQMGLEHEDGRVANADTGMWLHHGVMINRNQTDAVCGNMGQRFAASGNERTPIDISAGGLSKSGYYIGPDDEIAIAVDLMNIRQSDPQDDIVFTITYEYIMGDVPRPGDFSPITLYWLDVGGCQSSDVPALSNSTFIYTSPVLTGAQDGVITFVGGHLHDGGTYINLVKNGQIACAASADYSPYANVEDEGTTEHISAIDTCIMPGETTPSDSWQIAAYYDTATHAPMALMDGSLEPVMGIMLAYVAPKTQEEADPYPLLGRPRYWNVVLGLGLLVALVIAIAGWLWLRERRAIVLLQRDGDDGVGPVYKDRTSEEGEEAAVPLMNT